MPNQPQNAKLPPGAALQVKKSPLPIWPNIEDCTQKGYLIVFHLSSFLELNVFLAQNI